MNDEDELAYLSLQPPPEQVIQDGIQFESIELYLWSSAAFDPPSILFYAGPIYHEDEDPINAVNASDEVSIFVGNYV